MKFRRFIVVALGTLIPVVSAGVVAGQEPGQKTDSDSPRPVLSQDGSESLEKVFPPAAVLRQARALYRTEQRLKRLERNAWLGYQPLRPTTSAMPMTATRHAPPRLIHVPIFVYSR